MIPARVDRHEYDLTDRELAAAASTGDMRALGALYERYAPAMLATAYRLLLRRQDAEDVVHDTFVRLPEALRRYRDGNLGAWLRKVTVRMALSARRSDANRAIVTLDEHLTYGSGDPTARVALEQALAVLNPALRAVLVLKEIEGFSHAEIAELLDISEGSSQVRLHRALRALRAHLEKGEPP
ncbi:MAG TPA: RNA polymerase sigma factor [Gemmatimonadaceae bacterium]|nr:RNA polymerase sigma factor [Gemmatimonadaceae bacterium]